MSGRSSLGVAAGLLVSFALGWALGGGQPSPAGVTPFPAVSDEEPSEELQHILAIGSPRLRARALLDFLDRTDPSSAISLQEQLSDARADLMVDEITEILVASWWAEAAPEAAFAHPVDPPWTDRHPWMRTVVQQWAERDPVAAARAAQTVVGGPTKGRMEAARAVVDVWLELDELPDPTPILGVIAQLEPTARGAALHHVATTMIENRGIAATLDFVRSVPPDETLGGSVQHELFARTGVALLGFDTQSAVDWARELAGQPGGLGVHKHIAYYWALHEGRPAIEWAIALPDSPQKSSIIKRAWLSFSRRHRDDARDWLLSHPPRPLMSAVYRKFIETIAQTEPEQALALADRTEDADLRQQMRAAAGEGWMKLDPDAASTWLAGAGLPADLEARVRRARFPSSRPGRG